MTAPKESAQQTAAYAAWFRKQVQASVDDSRASIDDDQARRQFAAKRAALAEQSSTTSMAAH